VTAYLSPCRTWRYSLTRDVAPLTGEGTVVFVGLNPSTADETQDDPTIRRCVGFAQRWGYARLKMLNLYAYRATDPRELRTAADPVGPDNDHVLSVVFGGCDLIVAAWGVGAAPARVAAIMDWPLRPRVCLGLTKDGAPRHPLYARGDSRLIAFPSARPSPAPPLSPGPSK
jgi:hypothetical protein